MPPDRRSGVGGWTRRDCLRQAMALGLVPSAAALLGGCVDPPLWTSAFIAKAADYGRDIASIVLAGLKELRVDPSEIRGKTVLLKPNLVEPRAGASHINTHPLVVRGAAEAFLRFGASRILVAEGPGHNRDTLLVLEASGLGEALVEDRIPFVDLNYDSVYEATNAGRWTDTRSFALPATLRRVDWIVSMPKMKTHHWAGVTLSMKNLFGVMPGSHYGWPKNLLHWKGIGQCILDINATVRPHFAIVDGIVGMEGDGPIMGTPKQAGVLVMGRSLPAVDATCARVMGIDPSKVPYLAKASGRLGPTAEFQIRQRGEPVSSVKTDFMLVERIPAQRGLRAT